MPSKGFQGLPKQERPSSETPLAAQRVPASGRGAWVSGATLPRGLAPEAHPSGDLASQGTLPGARSGAFPGLRGKVARAALRG